MRYMTWMGLVVLAVASGCGTSAQVRYSGKLAAAHSALVDEQPVLAAKLVEEAQEIASANKIEDTDARLLLAEARRVEGKNIQAFNAVQEVLKRDSANGMGNEIMGKLLLKEGKFGEAEQRFQTARSGCKDATTKRRLDDLINLARGLRAYADADPQVAKKYWAAISDADLRFSVDKSLKDVGQPTAAR